MLRWLALGLLGLSFLNGCGEHSCAPVGCGPSVRVALSAPNDTWADGTYTLRVALDAEEIRCTKVLPDTSPNPGQSLPFECEPPFKDAFTFRAWFSPKMVCTETLAGDAVSESCMYVPDRYTLNLRYREATPRQVSLALERDDVLLVEETHTLSYRDQSVSGQCGDCPGAELAIELP